MRHEAVSRAPCAYMGCSAPCACRLAVEEFGAPFMDCVYVSLLKLQQIVSTEAHHKSCGCLDLARTMAAPSYTVKRFILRDMSIIVSSADDFHTMTLTGPMTLRVANTLGQVDTQQQYAFPHSMLPFTASPAFQHHGNDIHTLPELLHCKWTPTA